MDYSGLEEKFRKYLKRYVETVLEKEPKGAITRLAKQFGKSQGNLTNIISGVRPPGDESWRRMVAEKIGVDYEVMIGLNKPTNEKEKKKNQSKNIVQFSVHNNHSPKISHEKYGPCRSALDAIFESGDEETINAIYQNLIVFKKLGERDQKIETQDQKIESLMVEVDALKRRPVNGEG